MPIRCNELPINFYHTSCTIDTSQASWDYVVASGPYAYIEFMGLCIGPYAYIEFMGLCSGPHV